MLQSSLHLTADSGSSDMRQVLAAFALTALITFGAILIGYFSNSLPEEHLSSLDFAVIDWFSASPLGRSLSYLRSNFVPLLRKCLLMKSPRHRKPLTKQRREVAFEKFVLALSDQQLVTGIAILVAIFSNHCRTSVYELDIAISLAWFSSTTHLGTLDVLHRYFRQNIVVRNWRMVGMVGVLILLIPGLVLVETYVFTSPGVPMQCAHFLPTNPDAGIGPLAAVFVIMYLCTGYGSRLYKTFTSEDGSMMDPEWLIWNAILMIFSKKSSQNRHATIEKAINVCNTRRTLLVEAKVEAISTKYRFFKRLGLCIGAYSRSFLQCIAALMFFLSYGISGVVADRWLDYSVDLEEGSSTMEFGQIVPLVLLILPLLAFAEIFYGEPPSPKSLQLQHYSNTTQHYTHRNVEKPDQEHTIENNTTSSHSQPDPPITEKHPTTYLHDSHQNQSHPSIARNSHSRSSSHFPPPPHYAIFARADIKSRLPRPFLDRSLHLIALIAFVQISLGIIAGIVSKQLSPSMPSPLISIETDPEHLRRRRLWWCSKLTLPS